MSTLLAGLVLAVAVQAPAPLDVRWVPEFGLVTLSSEGSRIDVRMQKDGTDRRESFGIPGLAAGARILEARCGPWLEKEMVVVLVVQEGATASYRYALSAFSRPQARGDDATESHFVDAEHHWFLANPIFTSTGDPYRVVAVNDHTSGDAFEITFRRGWIKRIEDAAKIEEKTLFDSCGGYIVEPLAFGRAVLLERGGAPR